MAVTLKDACERSCTISYGCVVFALSIEVFRVVSNVVFQYKVCTGEVVGLETIEADCFLGEQIQLTGVFNHKWVNPSAVAIPWYGGEIGRDGYIAGRRLKGVAVGQGDVVVVGILHCIGGHVKTVYVAQCDRGAGQIIICFPIVENGLCRSANISLSRHGVDTKGTVVSGLIIEPGSNVDGLSVDGAMIVVVICEGDVARIHTEDSTALSTRCVVYLRVEH